MIKILHVISDTNIGGAGRLLLNLLVEANRGLFDFSVVLPHGSLLKKEIEKLNVKVAESDLGFFDLCRIIKTEKPQIVHTHACAKARIAAKICGCKTVNTKHCAEDVYPQVPFYKRLAYFVFDAFFTDKTIATAEYAKKNLTEHGIPTRKIAVIVNGSKPLKVLSESEKASVRNRFGYSDKDFLIGIVARVEHGKGHECFLQAAEICLKRCPQAKFLIVGNGSLLEETKRMAQNMPNVKFLGFVQDVSKIMNILDVNVNCSYISETSSLSLSEGMSVGAIPVVSDCGGNRFMAEGCGIVFEKNNFEMLAKVITDLSSNPEKLKLLSSKAKKRFSSLFTAEKMAEEMGKIYQSLVKA